ncbi:MAG: hypothetical protein ACK4UN_10295 [Limisphaerales bacterium]
MAKFIVQLSTLQGCLLQRLGIGVTLIIICGLQLGCATRQPGNDRPFSFPQDTFAYANELNWEYGFDESGKWSATKRDPKPDYTLHCFVVARSAKQFFQNARFVKALPKEDEEGNRRLIRRVVKSSPRKILPSNEKIIIPGYSNLREFSEENEELLKQECGGAWLSYLQRGNWRMVFPFSHRNQSTEAERLFRRIQDNNAPVVHIVRFPSLDVNHAILLFDAQENETAISFSVYDPNKPEKPTTLIFDRDTKNFYFPQNDYFIGGKVDVYEVYSSFVK